MRVMRTVFRACGCLALLVSVFGPLAGGADAAEPINGRALVIGIQDYAKASRLQGVANDVRLLASTLAERGGYEVQTVLNSAKGDAAAMFDDLSERECLQETIANWLAERQADETILLYFSGHGFRDDEDRLYLAAVDCDPSNPKPGGLPIAWLREKLLACRARAKLLILDACHAGSTRATDSQNVLVAKELTDFFEETKGLVTLASCTGEQNSYLWPAKRQSIFTYWLAHGLCGNADREPLGEITLNELDDYISKKVQRSAKMLHSAKQLPTRLQGPGVTKNVVMRLKPGDLKRLLDDMAEQMDVLIRLNDIQRVGVVPQFTSGTTGDVLNNKFGSLATYIPVELAGRLGSKSEGDYSVINTKAMRELLQEKSIAAKDIGTSKCRGISIEGNSIPAVIGGRVEGLRDGTIALQCKLLGVDSCEVFGIAGGMARLCGSESAMPGISGLAQPVAETPEGTGEVAIPPEFQPARFDADADHPMRQESFSYRARLLVKGSDGKFRERDGTFRGNDCHVALQKGEIFRVYITNRGNKPVFARVLVDGLNTLPEKSRTKGVYVEPRVINQWQQAQPVNLAEARAWGPLEPGKEYSISGFFLKTGTDAIYDEFKVVDAARSIASQAGYTDQLGLITAAFYDPKKKSPPPPPGGRSAVGRGGRYQTQTETYRGDHEPGRILAVVHIRYGE